RVAARPRQLRGPVAGVPAPRPAHPVGVAPALEVDPPGPAAPDREQGAGGVRPRRPPGHLVPDQPPVLLGPALVVRMASRPVQTDTPGTPFSIPRGHFSGPLSWPPEPDGGWMRPRQATERWPGPFGVPADALSVGDVWHSPAGRTITESDLVGFAGVSGDFFALHTDEAWAEGTRFGGRIAHGMLVLSVASGLWHLDPDVVVALYGLDRVR